MLMDASCRNGRALAAIAAADYHSRMPARAEPDFQLVERPDLYTELHRPFALRTGERVAARLLLALLRMPGGARILRAWHARRNG
jgi:hypothetical protein